MLPSQQSAMTLVPLPLDEAVAFAAVSFSLFSEPLGQALTRSAVKEFVRRAKLVQLSAPGIIELVTEIAGSVNFAGVSKLLALYEVYAGVQLDFTSKMWVGDPDTEMDPAVTAAIRAAQEAVNTGPPEETLQWPESGDSRARDTTRSQHLQLSTKASKIVRKRANAPIWTQRLMKSVEKE